MLKADEIRKHLDEVVTALGCEIVDVEFKSNPDLTLTVFIDKEVTGVSLDDCEKVHYAIDPILDEVDPSDGKPYTLNVSSPGLDRPFKTQRDFERNYGKEVEIKLYAPLMGKKTLEGVLKEKTASTVTIADAKTGKETVLESNKAAVVRPLIKFE